MQRKTLDHNANLIYPIGNTLQSASEKISVKNALQFHEKALDEMWNCADYSAAKTE